MPMNMGESDEEDIETLRAAALLSLKNKADNSEHFSVHSSQPQWNAVGGRRGMGKHFQHPSNRARRVPGVPGGRGGGPGFDWITCPQLINRSNLISIIPMNTDTLTTTSEQKNKIDKFEDSQTLNVIENSDKSSVPDKFSRFENKDSEESEDDDEVEDKAPLEEQSTEPEEADPDVILMQDEDSLGKLLDEFEQELQEEMTPLKSEPIKKSPPPPAKRHIECTKNQEEPRLVSPMRRKSPSRKKRSPSPDIRRRSSPLSPDLRKKRSLSPNVRRRPSPPSPSIRRRPSPLSPNIRRRSSPLSPSIRRRPSPLSPKLRRRPSPLSPNLRRRPSPLSPNLRRRPSPISPDLRRRPSPPSPGSRRRPSPLSPKMRRRPSPQSPDLRRRPSPPSPNIRRRPSPQSPDLRRRPSPPSPNIRRRPSPQSPDLRRRPSPPSPNIRRRPSPQSPDLRRRPSPPSPNIRRRPSPLSPNIRRRPSPPSPDLRRRSSPLSPDLRRRPVSPRPHKHFSPLKRSISRSLSPPPRRRSPPRRATYIRRSPSPGVRWRSSPRQYSTPTRIVSSPQAHQSSQDIRTHSESPECPLRKGKTSPCDKIRSKSPLSPKHQRKIVSTHSISPNSKTLSPFSRSLSRSLSLSPSPPPRASEALYPVTSPGMKNKRILIGAKKSWSNKNDKNSSKKESKNCLKTPKVRKQKSSKPISFDAVEGITPLLEARRRKFECSAPIQVDNKKIRLSLKDSVMPVVPSKDSSQKPSVSTAITERDENNWRKKEFINKTKEGPQVTTNEEQRNDDLRAELRRRKADRLHQAGNVHHIVPTRLVQSALHGVVGKKTTSLQRKEKVVISPIVITAIKDQRKKSEKKLELKSSRSEGRRVMVVRKREESSPEPEETRSSPQTTVTSLNKGEGESSKGPVHTRLGSVARIVHTSSSRQDKSKISKIVASKVALPSQVQDSFNELHISHKKKEKRKFRLKRSKQRSASPSSTQKD